MLVQTGSYVVIGMTCSHCAQTVTNAVSGVAGITDVDVELQSGTLTVTSDGPVDEGAVIAAVDNAGYGVAG